MSKKEIITRKKKSIKILISDGESKAYIDFLNKIYKITRVTTFSEYIAEEKASDGMPYRAFNLIVFTGGADVNPKLYGEQQGAHTVTDINRDKKEERIYHSFNGSGVRMLGICRGAQFITVMNGGKLIQHVENHKKKHLISSKLESHIIANFEISSTHHQMMFPFNVPSSNWDLLAWSKVFNSNVYLNGANKDVKLPHGFLEPEIILFSRGQMCIQGHPEHDDCPEETVTFITKLLQSYLL